MKEKENIHDYINMYLAIDDKETVKKKSSQETIDISDQHEYVFITLSGTDIYDMKLCESLEQCITYLLKLSCECNLFSALQGVLKCIYKTIEIASDTDILKRLLTTYTSFDFDSEQDEKEAMMLCTCKIQTVLQRLDLGETFLICTDLPVQRVNLAHTSLISKELLWQRSLSAYTYLIWTVPPRKCFLSPHFIVLGNSHIQSHTLIESCLLGRKKYVNHSISELFLRKSLEGYSVENHGFGYPGYISAMSNTSDITQYCIKDFFLRGISDLILRNLDSKETVCLAHVHFRCVEIKKLFHENSTRTTALYSKGLPDDLGKTDMLLSEDNQSIYGDILDDLRKLCMKDQVLVTEAEGKDTQETGFHDEFMDLFIISSLMPRWLSQKCSMLQTLLNFILEDEDFLFYSKLLTYEKMKTMFEEGRPVGNGESLIFTYHDIDDTAQNKSSRDLFCAQGVEHFEKSFEKEYSEAFFRSEDDSICMIFEETNSEFSVLCVSGMSYEEVCIQGYEHNTRDIRQQSFSVPYLCEEISYLQEKVNLLMEQVTYVTEKECGKCTCASDFNSRSDMSNTSKVNKCDQLSSPSHSKGNGNENSSSSDCAESISKICYANMGQSHQEMPEIKYSNKPGKEGRDEENYSETETCNIEEKIDSPEDPYSDQVTKTEKRINISNVGHDINDLLDASTELDSIAGNREQMEKDNPNDKNESLLSSRACTMTMSDETLPDSGYTDVLMGVNAEDNVKTMEQISIWSSHSQSADVTLGSLLLSGETQNVYPSDASEEIVVSFCHESMEQNELLEVRIEDLYKTEHQTRRKDEKQLNDHTEGSQSKNLTLQLSLKQQVLSESLNGGEISQESSVMDNASQNNPIIDKSSWKRSISITDNTTSERSVSDNISTESSEFDSASKECTVVDDHSRDRSLVKDLSREQLLSDNTLESSAFLKVSKGLSALHNRPKESLLELESSVINIDSQSCPMRDNTSSNSSLADNITLSVVNNLSSESSVILTNGSKLNTTSPFEVSVVNNTTLLEPSLLDNTSQLELSVVDNTSLHAASVVHMTSLLETSFVDNTSLLEPSVVDNASLLEPSVVDNASLLEPSVVDNTSLLEPSVVDNASLLEPSVVDNTSLLELSAVGNTSLLEPSVVDNTSLLEPSAEDNTSLLEPSVVDNASLLEPSVVDNTSLLEPSVVDNTSLLEPSVVDNTSLLEPSAVDSTSLHEPSVVDNTSLLEPSAVDNASLLEHSAVDNTSPLEPSVVDNISLLESSAVDNTSRLELSVVDNTSLLEPSAVDNTSQHEVPVVNNTSLVENKSLLESSAMQIISVLETSFVDNTCLLEPILVNNTSVFEPSFVDNTLQTEPLVMDNTLLTEPLVTDNTSLHKPSALDYLQYTSLLTALVVDNKSLFETSVVDNTLLLNALDLNNKSPYEPFVEDNMSLLQPSMVDSTSLLEHSVMDKASQCETSAVDSTLLLGAIYMDNTTLLEKSFVDNTPLLKPSIVDENSPLEVSVVDRMQLETSLVDNIPLQEPSVKSSGKEDILQESLVVVNPSKHSVVDINVLIDSSVEEGTITGSDFPASPLDDSQCAEKNKMELRVNLKKFYLKSEVDKCAKSKIHEQSFVHDVNIRLREISTAELVNYFFKYVWFENVTKSSTKLQKLCDDIINHYLKHLKYCYDESQIYPAQAPRTGLDGFFQRVLQGEEMNYRQKMQYEWLRIQSFWSFPINIGMSMIYLARNGFYYTGRSTECRCYFCGHTYSDWEMSDNNSERITEIHTRISPNCVFLTGGNHDNVPIHQESPVSFAFGQVPPSGESRTTEGSASSSSSRATSSFEAIDQSDQRQTSTSEAHPHVVPSPSLTIPETIDSSGQARSVSPVSGTAQSSTTTESSNQQGAPSVTASSSSELLPTLQPTTSQSGATFLVEPSPTISLPLPSRSSHTGPSEQAPLQSKSSPERDSSSSQGQNIHEKLQSSGAPTSVSSTSSQATAIVPHSVLRASGQSSGQTASGETTVTRSQSSAGGYTSDNAQSKDDRRETYDVQVVDVVTGLSNASSTTRKVVYRVTLHLSEFQYSEELNDTNHQEFLRICGQLTPIFEHLFHNVQGDQRINIIRFIPNPPVLVVFDLESYNFSDEAILRSIFSRAIQRGAISKYRISPAGFEFSLIEESNMPGEGASGLEQPAASSTTRKAATSASGQQHATETGRPRTGTSTTAPPRPQRFDPLGINFDRPRYPAYALLTVRSATYTDWPTALTQEPLQMAVAGFFYAGYGDYVRCFFCGGGLRNWDDGDDPWEEHAKWFPRCAFVRQNKGEKFVNDVQRRHHEQGAGIEFEDEVEEQVPDEELPAFRSLLEMNYSPETIRRAIETFRQRIRPGRQIGLPMSATNLADIIFEFEEGNNDNSIGENRQDRGEQAEAARTETGTSTEAARTETGTSTEAARTGTGTSTEAARTGTGTSTEAARTETGTSTEAARTETGTSTEAARTGTGTSTEAARTETGTSTEAARTETATTPDNVVESGRMSEEERRAEQTKLLDDPSAGDISEESEDDLERMKEENISWKEKLKCKICLEKDVAVAFLPCGHLVCCTDCAPAIRICIICNDIVKGTVKTFFP